MKHALKEDIKWKLVKLPSNQPTPFVNVVQFPSRTDEMHVDEIDTVLLLRTQSLTDSRRKPILQQNYIQIDRDKQGYVILKCVKL